MNMTIAEWRLIVTALKLAAMTYDAEAKRLSSEMKFREYRDAGISAEAFHRQAMKIEREMPKGSMDVTIG